MKELAKQFAEVCEREIQDWNRGVEYNYKSLSVCIIDCIYSLRVKYNAVVVPIIERYAEKYLDGKAAEGVETCSNLIKHINDVGTEKFANDILKNGTLSGGILKSVVVLDLATKFVELGIESISDFRNYTDEAGLMRAMMSVGGVGKTAANYMFMLAGDPSKCKPDVHIKRFVVNACGQNISYAKIQELFTETVKILSKKHPGLTVRMLDGIIWRQSSNS